MKRGEGCARTVREVEIIDMLISFFLMIIVSTSLTVPGQPSSQFHVEAWLFFSRGTVKWIILNPSGHKKIPRLFPDQQLNFPDLVCSSLNKYKLINYYFGVKWTSH